ncbi:MAG: hypothetical protein HYY17_05895 [Planctomycetes bacterium]|nr:hypothetical protein [Planctomycetota bacterium]
MDPILLADGIMDWIPTKLWQWIVILLCGAGLGIGLFLRNKARKAAGL